MKTKLHEVKDYCCIHGFVDTIVDKILDHVNDDSYSIDIIAYGDLTEDLIRCLMAIETDDDGFMFNMQDVDYNGLEYNGEYVLTINNDFELWCEPAYRDNEYGEGYIYTESDDCFVYEDSNREVMDKIESGNVTIFGFKGDNEFEN